MPRPTFTTRLSLPHRLKRPTSCYNSSSTPSTQTPASSVPASRNSSPRTRPMPEQPAPAGLVLRVNVIKGRDLAAKDRSGTSDPYLVLTLGDAKITTPTINKQLNPEWNETLELPIVGEQSLLLEVVCWDKDRFGKDYMGEFDVILEDHFQNGLTQQEPQWFPLEARRSGKKKSVVSGEIQMQFTLIDPQNLSASPEQTLQKFFAIAGQAPSPDEYDEDLGGNSNSNSTDAEEDDSSSDEAQDESKKAEKREKRRKKLKLARLKRKVKGQTGYAYSSSGDVAGVLFLEVQRCSDLPPERNVTRTTFDMDPFVITSLGKNTYRTKTVRHDLNPVFDEKLVFQVMRHETNYSVNFTVMDKDKFSGNDYVGTVNFPLEKAISTAPQEDPETGLYKLPEPSDSPGISPDGGSKKSRFRIPMSRSGSSHSLSRLGRPSLKKESSTGSLSVQDANGTQPPSPGAPPSALTDSNGNLTPGSTLNLQPSAVDDEDLKMYTLPLELKHQERWENKHSPTLYIRAKYLPYKALRQQFWRAMLKQYDADESGLLDKVELTTMLDTLGSTLHEATIDSFFERFAYRHNGEHLLTFDEAVICLEDQLEATEAKNAKRDGSFVSGSQTPMTSGMLTPINQSSSTTSIPVLETNTLGKEGEEGADIQIDDLADEKGEEHVIEIRECPICHQPKLNKRSDANIITHIATCASQDWRQVNNIVMAGFVTSSQAQRKWYSKVITKISYGGYKLGANSANILVQDRLTGQINEERMSVYVRLGIRLLYKGLKANNMEKKRIRKLLKSLSFKQGRKYDDPASASEIIPFINFHQLDMSEVLLPTDQFKNFNEFFYRALKPGARPCSAPDDPRVIVSPSDCRTVVFNTIDSAQAIWVKGRDFTIERLLGDAYPQDVKRYHGGSLGIFRLAPQDYHRFHIPVDGVLDEPKTIEGEYYTVNPMAIRSALDVYGENVRVVVPIDSVAHGRVMIICVGAMMVGSTVITRKKGEQVKRAEELGYFKFGGSTLLLLFEPGQMRYDEDLVENSNSALETLVRVGMSIGHSPNRPAHVPDMRKSNPTHEEKQDAKRRIEGSLAPAGVKGPMPGAGM